MRDQKRTVKFKLLGRVSTSNTWDLPMKTEMLPKAPNGGVGKMGSNHPLKLIQYIPGETSIFKEDHKGDQRGRIPTFKKGVLEVSVNDIPLMTILKNHRLFNKKFVIDDADQNAQKEIDKFDSVQKAFELINVSDPDRARAMAMVLMGEVYFIKSDKIVKAELQKLAYNKPEIILTKIKATNYNSLLLASYSVVTEVLKINESRTAVVWADTNRPVVTVAVNQDPVTVLGEFLSGNSENVKITMQIIGEKIKEKRTKKEPLNIDELLGNDIQQKQSSGDGEVDYTLETAREKYLEVNGTKVPNNKKNDLDWIVEKIKEKELATSSV